MNFLVYILFHPNFRRFYMVLIAIFEQFRLGMSEDHLDCDNMAELGDLSVFHKALKNINLLK